MYNQRIEVLRARRVVGDYNRQELSWSDPEVTRVPFGVEMQPTEVDEVDENNRRVLVRENWVVISPPNRYIQAEPTDRIRTLPDNQVFEVIGEPQDWNHASHGHTEIRLRRIRG